MDERKQEVKRLRVTGKRIKRKYVTAWKTLAIIMMVLALLFVPQSLAPQLCSSIAQVFARWDEGALLWLCRGIAAASLVLLAVFAGLWGRGKRKWQKTQEYLEYQTLKRTLKAEKEEAKQKMYTVIP